MAPFVRVNSLHPEGRTQPCVDVSWVRSEAGKRSDQHAGSVRLCNFRTSLSSPGVSAPACSFSPLISPFRARVFTLLQGESLAPLISRVTMSCEPCGFPGFRFICGLKADLSRQLKAWQECLHPQSLLLSNWVWGSPAVGSWGR